MTDVSFDHDLPLSVIIRRTNVPNAALDLLDQEVSRFREKHSPPEHKTYTPGPVPDHISLADKTIVSNNSSHDTKVIEKNEKLISFLAIMFSRATYDRNGNISSLSPGELTDEAKELFTSSSTTTEQSQNLFDALDAHIKTIEKERTYISRETDFPFLSLTLLTFFLKGYHHTWSIEKHPEALKKTFNVLALLPPPVSDEYNKYVSSSRNNEIESVLDHPTEKRSSLRKEVFVKGRQDTIRDAISFISNIIAFARFWIKMSDDPHDQPALITTLIEISDYISASEFHSFASRHISTRPYIPHTIISYVYNIISIYVTMAKNPKTIRKLKYDNDIDGKELKMSTIIAENLLDQLRLCSLTCSPQNIFASPPTTLKILCPHLAKDDTKKPHDDGKKRTSDTANLDNGKEQSPKKHKGCIVNTTGKRIMLPKGLSKKYCSEFLDTGTSCRHGDACHFEHAAYPHGFPDEDVKLLDEWIDKMDGYKFAFKKPTNKVS